MISECPIHKTALIQLGSEMACLDCLADMTLDRNAEMAAFEAKQLRDERVRRLRASDIPAMYRNSTFEALKLPEVSSDRAARLHGAMARYAENFAQTRTKRTGFLFIGGPGTGKTHLACLVALKVIEAGFSAKYTSLPSLTLQLRATYKDFRTSAQDILDGLIRADLLVIDEIDLHGASDSDYQMLYEIINARYITGDRPTIAISNRTLEHLSEDLNERIVSRIIGNYPPNVFSWEPFRTGGKIEKNGMPS